MQDTMTMNSTVALEGGTTAPSTDGAPQPTFTPAPKPQSDGRSFAIASFVIGLASIVSGWTLVAPVVGLILGVLALRRETPERTLALWGVWMNAAILALVAIMLVFGIGLLIFGLMAGTIY